MLLLQALRSSALVENRLDEALYRLRQAEKEIESLKIFVKNLQDKLEIRATVLDDEERWTSSEVEKRLNGLPMPAPRTSLTENNKNNSTGKLTIGSNSTSTTATVPPSASGAGNIPPPPPLPTYITPFSSTNSTKVGRNFNLNSPNSILIKK